MTHAHDFQDQECATSLISCTLSGDPNSSYSSSSGASNTYYCVGTAHVIPAEAEPKAGRLLLFQLVEGMILCGMTSLCWFCFFSVIFPIFTCRIHYHRQKTTYREAQKAMRTNNKFFFWVANRPYIEKKTYIFHNFARFTGLFQESLFKSLKKKSKAPFTHLWSSMENFWPASTAWYETFVTLLLSRRMKLRYRDF